ncbi:MAG: DNA mismatch repair endonuclease MutL, partial [Halanaerobiales bacterium]
MSEIKELPANVADQIAAGEVIERPASVVKELVENSIDAAADRILVEVKNGGKDFIRVKDNGNGIKNDQLKLALSRHTTSKIEEINDLYSLKTLGFRGEALSSIASVSEMEISTREKENMSGKRMKIKGGEIINTETTGCPAGTDIKVKNLFFNTPARYK